MAFLLQLPHWFQILYIVLIALCIGSFLNVVIFRLPIQMKSHWYKECTDYLDQHTKLPDADWALSLWRSRSHCPQCATPICWYDNIPVISWLLLEGKCRFCKASIRLRYPMVELLTALICLVYYLKLGANTTFLLSLPFIFVLITLSFIDLDEQLLPDNLTLPLLWLGLLININGTLVSLPSAVIGAAVGYLCLWSIYHFFRLLTGKEGMGYGDFKLMAALGAWMGWQCIPALLLISSLLGACAGILYLAIRHKSLAFPFGPYLAIAGLLCMLYHPVFMTWYLVRV